MNYDQWLFFVDELRQSTLTAAELQTRLVEKFLALPVL